MKSKRWVDFTLEEKVFFWNVRGLADEEIAYRESLDTNKVKEILGNKSRSLRERVSFLHFIHKYTDEQILYELFLDKNRFSEKNVKEIREKLGLKPNSRPFSHCAFWPKITPDPSH